LKFDKSIPYGEIYPATECGMNAMLQNAIGLSAFRVDGLGIV